MIGTRLALIKADFILFLYHLVFCYRKCIVILYIQRVCVCVYSRDLQRVCYVYITARRASDWAIIKNSDVTTTTARARDALSMYAFYLREPQDRRVCKKRHDLDANCGVEKMTPWAPTHRYSAAPQNDFTTARAFNPLCARNSLAENCLVFATRRSVVYHNIISEKKHIYIYIVTMARDDY